MFSFIYMHIERDLIYPRESLYMPPLDVTSTYMASVDQGSLLRVPTRVLKIQGAWAMNMGMYVPRYFVGQE